MSAKHPHPHTAAPHLTTAQPRSARGGAGLGAAKRGPVRLDSLRPGGERLAARLAHWLLLVTQLCAWLLVALPAKADLAFDDDRSVRRWVLIENLNDFPNWKLVAYPYNFSGGVPQYGLAEFEAIGLRTGGGYAEPRIFALPAKAEANIKRGGREAEGLAELQRLNAVASDVTLGDSERVPRSSPVLGVVEHLRIRTLTPERLELQRVALEYELDNDKREVVKCDATGRCPEPSSGPALKLQLTQPVRKADAGAPPQPDASSAVAPSAATGSAATPLSGDAPPATDTTAPDPDRNGWIAFSLLLLLAVGFVVYRLRRPSTPQGLPGTKATPSDPARSESTPDEPSEPPPSEPPPHD